VELPPDAVPLPLTTQLVVHPLPPVVLVIVVVLLVVVPLELVVVVEVEVVVPEDDPVEF